jgi:hypothetical protein
MKHYIIHNKKQAECQEFYHSPIWKSTRQQVLDSNQHICKICGVSLMIMDVNVDHILPLKYYWDQRLDLDNLQISCKDCNKIKGNKYQRDWLYDVLEKRYKDYIKTLPTQEEKDQIRCALRLLEDDIVDNKLSGYFELKDKNLLPPKRAGDLYEWSSWVRSEAIKILLSEYVYGAYAHQE